MISPKELDIKLSYQCNNACIFCLNKEKKVLEDLPLESLKEQIIDFSLKGGTKLIISGGEPLINKNFFEIMNFAKERGINVFEIQTNGRMLYYKKIADFFKNFGYVGFLISLHYPNKELYKKYSQTNGFDQTIDGIKNIIKNNFPFTISTVLMKQTLPYLGELWKLLKKLGVKKWQLRFIDGKNVSKEYKKFVPEYKECLPTLRKILREEKDIKIFLKEFPLCILGEEFFSFLSPKFSPNRVNLTNNNEIILTKDILKEQFFFSKKCKNCAYIDFCDGIRKKYYNFYGDKEIRALKKNKCEKRYISSYQ
jgi:MoaA/NifB/PqqE/SkfB family radical SAM enzyme